MKPLLCLEIELNTMHTNFSDTAEHIYINLIVMDKG